MKKCQVPWGDFLTHTVVTGTRRCKVCEHHPGIAVAALVTCSATDPV